MTSILPLLSFFTQDDFPSLAKWSFFNHSGVSPLPRRAADAIRLYTQQSEADGYMTGKWYQQAETTRKLAAKMINADPKEIAFVKNTSEGLAFVSNGLAWQAGDEIISTSSEYPANVYPWMAAAKRFGARHIMVRERSDGRIALDDLFAAVTPRTRMIAISHVEYASGYRNDVAAIGEFCRTHKNARGEKILFCVDAIQSIGAVLVDVKAMQIDYLSAGGHKWMLGPEGLGIFFCRLELLDTLEPEVGWMNVAKASDFVNFDFTLKGDARRFECGGYNIAGVLGLGASLKLLSETGMETVSGRLKALTDLLVEGVRGKGYTVYSPRERDEWSGIVSFYSPGQPASEIATLTRELDAKHIIIVERAGRLRAAPHFYQSEVQIKNLIDALPAH
jgi:cysteine desulfurase/selenocysteine lyase